MGRRAACAAGEPGGDPWNLEVSTIGHDSRQFSPARYPPPVAQEHTRRLRKALYTHCWPATGHGAAAASWHVGLIVAACAGPLHARRHTDSTTAARRGRAPRPARIHSRCGTPAGSVQGRDFGPVLDNARYLRFTTAPSSQHTQRQRRGEQRGLRALRTGGARAGVRAGAELRGEAVRACRAPAGGNGRLGGHLAVVRVRAVAREQRQVRSGLAGRRHTRRRAAAGDCAPPRAPCVCLSGPRGGCVRTPLRAAARPLAPAAAGAP
jgi:hypothetical protein